MHGLLKTRVPLVARRVLTLVPALVILAVGIDPTHALILSQVALSFGIPFAVVPLVWLTSRRSLMGTFTNRPLTTLTAAVAAVGLISLNVALVVLTVTAT